MSMICGSDFEIICHWYWLHVAECQKCSANYFKKCGLGAMVREILDSYEHSI